MICGYCNHPEWEHVEGECEHKYIDDPRDPSHLCDCRRFIPPAPITTKVVTMVIEVRTASAGEDLAKAVSDYLKGQHFRDGLTHALQDEIGHGFELEPGGSVEVEDEK